MKWQQCNGAKCNEIGATSFTTRSNICLKYYDKRWWIWSDNNGTNATLVPRSVKWQQCNGTKCNEIGATLFGITDRITWSTNNVNII